ncbi:MAG TPA: exodeoxyribonuclease VII large subunit [Dehalococcoidia bacterium]|nr:exodeoxyribonuclease VII large subunit [Dehalococcoidia bacterium]
MHVYAVREVTTYLRELFESNPHLGDIWIEGECSNVSRPASGHVYFTLKDGDAQLRAAFFQRRNAPSNTTSRLVENGAAVVLHGRIGIYEQRGELQLYVDFVQPEGVGALQAEYERLKSRLGEEGLFDESRKRPLPRFPRRIGVVTSESGAVFHDICRVVERRWPIAEVVLAPTPVQGPDAVPGIIGAIDQLNRLGDVDVIIAGRGGGALEELWAFNDEFVARAIFASRLPIISAVGHETDTTIADFVADVRAPTPSAAAEIVAPDRLEVSVRLGVAVGTMESVLRQQLVGERASLRQRLRVVERAAPDVNRHRQRADDLARRGSASIEHVLRGAVQGVGGCVWRLKALDPFATLDRGYAIVQRAGVVVSSVAQARPGDAIDVRVRDGTFGAQVGGGAVRAKRPRRAVPDAQAPLFTMPEERA